MSETLKDVIKEVIEGDAIQASADVFLRMAHAIINERGDREAYRFSARVMLDAVKTYSHMVKEAQTRA